MWAGMTEGAFEIVPHYAVHHATGLRLQRSHYQNGASPEPWPLTFPDVSQPCLVTIIQYPSLARAREMEQPYDAPGDSERFRRTFGRLSHVERIEGVGRASASRWTRATLEVFCTLFFMLDDPEGFRNGDRAYPDSIEIDEPTLSRDLRGRLQHPYS